MLFLMASLTAGCATSPECGWVTPFRLHDGDVLSRPTKEWAVSHNMLYAEYCGGD